MNKLQEAISRYINKIDKTLSDNVKWLISQNHYNNRDKMIRDIQEAEQMDMRKQDK